MASARVGVASRAHAGLRVGWVAYHFPPLGGAGTQRSLKFAANLSRFDVHPVVVTGSGTQSGPWTPVDPTLAAEIPSDVDVQRLAGDEPRLPGDGWSGRFERWCLTRSAWERWWQSGVSSALVRLAPFDLLHASMSPFSTAEAVALAASRLRVPWLAGLRDPWALDEMLAYPTGAHRLVEQRRMRRALATASAIIMTTDEAARRVREAFPELDTRVCSIPNGFDAGDFSGVVPPRRDGTFRIVHAGTLHTAGAQTGMSDRLRRRLGGEILGVDVATRTHVQLTEAVRALRVEEPDLGEQIEVHLAGVTTAADREAAGDCSFVRFHGYLPHSKSISLLRSADLLFLPMHRIRSGERAGIVPGKTYEYLATGRPILAAVPEGDARDIVSRAGTGLVCDPGDVRAMKALIRGQVMRWRAGEDAPPLDAGYVGQFERRVLTARLVDLMHSALEPREARRVAV